LYNYTLGAQGDYLSIKSNGSSWFESNKKPGGSVS
jgi:hypothetical protein